MWPESRIAVAIGIDKMFMLSFSGVAVAQRNRFHADNKKSDTHYRGIGFLRFTDFLKFYQAISPL